MKRFHDPGDWMESPTGEYVLHSDMMGQLEMQATRLNRAEGEVFELKNKLRIADEQIESLQNKWATRPLSRQARHVKNLERLRRLVKMIQKAGVE